MGARVTRNVTDRAKPTALKKKRQNRLYQFKHRGSARSYKTELENTRVILAWVAEELTEGQAATALGIDRVSLRIMRDGSITHGLMIAESLR
jgi:hypothetical protein